MNTIVYSPDVPVHHLNGGRIGLGHYFFPGRQARGATYQVRLSVKAREILEYCDIIRWWDTSHEFPSLECAGEIEKPDGTIYHLVGFRDVGIDTGHPPHLGLKMVQTWRTVWETVSCGHHYQIAKAPWGKWYRYKRCTFPPLGSIANHEQMIEEGAEEFDGRTTYASKTERYLVDIKCEWNGWTTGWMWQQQKKVRLRDTDKPLVTRQPQLV